MEVGDAALLLAVLLLRRCCCLAGVCCLGSVWVVDVGHKQQVAHQLSAQLTTSPWSQPGLCGWWGSELFLQCSRLLLCLRSAPRKALSDDTIVDKQRVLLWLQRSCEAKITDL